MTFTRNASSADNCTVTNDRPNGAKVDFIGAGTCAVFAHQAGNDTYQPAPGHIRQQIKVYKKSQTITFQSTAPAHAVVGGHYDVSATASSGLDVRFTVPTGAKAACTITSQHANAATLSFARPGNLHRHRPPGRQRDLQRRPEGGAAFPRRHTPDRTDPPARRR